MTPAKIRIALNGSTDAEDGLLEMSTGGRAVITGDVTDIECGFFDPAGEPLNMLGVHAVTLSVYLARGGMLVFEPIVSSDINTGLTKEQWEAGTACHVRFRLTETETAVAFRGAQRDCWAVLDCLTSDGRRTLGAGTLIFRNVHGDGSGPEGGITPVYATLEQAQALIAQVEVVANPVPGIENVVYLAPRTDGKDGNGTKGNPFNVSTPERFDSVLERLGASPVFLQFEAGVYNVNHHHMDRWHVRNGWHAAGRGMDKTIFQIVNPYIGPGGSPGWWHTDPGGRLATYPEDYCYYASIRDLTIDGMQTWDDPDVSVNAVILRGSNITVERVEARRCGGGKYEIFPIALGHDWRIDEPCNLQILHCLVRETACGAQGSTAISFTGGGNTSPQFGTNPKQSAIAAFNRVIGGGYLGVANFHNWTFLENDVDMAGLPGGNGMGVNIDTGKCTKGRIIGNKFRNCHNAFRTLGAVTIGNDVTPEWVFDDIVIKDNYFHMFRNSAYGAVKLQGNTSNIDVFDNTVEIINGPNAAWAGIVFDGLNNETPRTRGNKMWNGSPLGPGLADNLPGDQTLRGNQLVDGDQTIEHDQTVGGKIKVGPASSISELDAYSVATFSGSHSTGVTGGLLQKGSGWCVWMLKRSGSTPSRWSFVLPAGSTALQLHTETEIPFRFTTSGELLGLLSNSTATFDRFKPGHGIFARAGSDWPTLSDLQDGYWCLWLKIPDNKFRFYARNGAALHYLELTPASP